MVDARLPLRQWLGSSDHSSVYLTEIAGPASPKAVVKIFPADFFNFDRQIQRWRALSQLHCPYLLRLLDGGRSEIDRTPFFFALTDFAEEDLSQVLPHRALTTDEVKQLLPPLLEGLTYLHKNGFVHGHIQPSNVMAAGDKLKLPVERIYAAGEHRDNTSPLSPYDAPEIATGTLTPAADVWSVGMFLVAALKQHPMDVRANPLAVPKIPADLPEPFRSIIGDCLVVDPKSRCTLTEIGAWLNPVAPVKTPAPKSAPEKTKEIRKETDVKQTGSKQTGVSQAGINAKKTVSPVRITEAPATPMAANRVAATPVAATPVKKHQSAWRIGAPIAAVVIIAALVLGQKLLTHKPETTPPASTSTPETQPAAQPAAQPTTAPAPEASTPQDPILHRVVPELSANTKRKVHGVIKINVRVEVDPSGKVIATKILTPSSSRYFNNLAQESAQQWEFAPPQQNGAPVQSAWLLRFQFSRRSAEVIPSRIARP